MYVFTQCVSVDLCKAIDKVVRRLCSSYVDPLVISILTACYLIALNKCPGIRLIEVEETLRYLICKTIIQVTCEDILKVVGSSQLCAGQEAACETWILGSLFEDVSTEALLMVDAFNSLNREVALRNIYVHCPVLVPVLINTYYTPSTSTTSPPGSSLMASAFSHKKAPHKVTMYAIAMLSLIWRLQGDEA